ncbi:carbohydrate ABC transporter permease [Dictyobacter kobayashii]|uniref:ABC transporter permease n=1 Tax=Dictyobacter kobayashii TaxID=2014872 RepID=A0A402AT01_9CHLR|nr:carbohydrate ABC transporter permease [Dictyobacter kobayashii]GCE22173.1 ABC transporter permease [Dictyobacter kobayashii]
MALFPAVGRKQPHVRISWWLLIAFLVLGIFLHLIPFYFMLITSFKTGSETLQTPPTLWPIHFDINAWKLAINVVNGEQLSSGGQQSANFFTYFGNSLLMTGLTLLFSTPVTALAAYANSKLQRGPVARWTFLFFIGTMLLPGAVMLVPTYLLIQHFPFPFSYVPELPSGDPYPSLQLNDTLWAVIVPSVFNAYGFLYFKAFFDTIPNSILQAARVDGGSELNIFRRIVFPMSIPVFAVVMSMQFSSIWDSFLWPSLVISSPQNLPISVAVYKLVNAFTSTGATNAEQAANTTTSAARLAQQGLSWNGIMVLSILQSLPIFFIFLISFRYLLKGIRIRGLK